MNHGNDTFFYADDLSVSFCTNVRGDKEELTVISNLTFQVDRGKILAIAGASGSGKSLLAHAILGLLPEHACQRGNMFLDHQELTGKRQEEVRGKEIALIPQAVTGLDPLMKIGSQVCGTDRTERVKKRKEEIFARLSLAPAVNQAYPHQLSGGMARRVLFSTAALSDASLIIADEPTPGMELSQALEALSILRELADAGAGVILITHDIDLAFHFADQVAVFYAGTILETAPATDFLKGSQDLRHPYSKALWRALPEHEFVPIPGNQPYAGHLPPGCLFAPRCPYKTAKCEQEIPPMRSLRGGTVRCIYAA